MGVYPVFETVEQVLSLPWEKHDKSEWTRLHGISCVYMFMNRETGIVEYVGKAADAYYRLGPASHHHVLDRNIHDVYVYPYRRGKVLDYLEATFIHILKPTKNKNRGHMPPGAFTDQSLIRALKKLPNIKYHRRHNFQPTLLEDDHA